MGTGQNNRDAFKVLGWSVQKEEIRKSEIIFTHQTWGPKTEIEV